MSRRRNDLRVGRSSRHGSGRVWLYAVSSGRPVAWTDDGRDYFDVELGKPFGWRERERLFSYRGGKPLGWFDDDTFHGLDGNPLYFVGRARHRSVR